MFVDIPPLINSKDTLQDLLAFLVDQGGSDLFLIGGERAWIDLNGKKIPITQRPLQVKEIETILCFAYGENAVSRLGEAEGIRFAYEFKAIKNGEKKRFRFRGNAVNCVEDSKLSISTVFRSIPSEPPRASEIGLEKTILDYIEKIKVGLFLVAGGTGNGKSTTMGSIVRHLLELEDGNTHLLTIEDPIEFVYSRIKKPSSFCAQLQVGNCVKTFEVGLFNALRMKPDVIYVGEAKNYSEIKLVFEAASTGHLGLTTIHANSIADIFQRIKNAYPEELQYRAESDLISALNGLVFQRLFKSTNGKRTAIREILFFDEEVKKRLLRCENKYLEIEKILKEKNQSMYCCAKRKYDEGIIDEKTLFEVELNYGA